MTAFAAHLHYSLRAGLRNRSLLLTNYLLPLGFYAVMGYMFVNIYPDFARTLVPAMIVLSGLTSLVIGMPAPLTEERDAGIYRNYWIHGLPAAAVVCVPAITSMMHMMAVALIISLTAPVLFGADAIASWPKAAVAVIALAYAAGGLGALIGVVSADSRAVLLWSQLVFQPSILLGGVMVPVEVLPAGLRLMGMLLPSGYAMQAFQALAMGRGDGVWPVLTLVAGGTVAFSLAIRLFSWDRRVRRTPAWLALAALAPYGAWVIRELLS